MRLTAIKRSQQNEHEELGRFFTSWRDRFDGAFARAKPELSDDEVLIVRNALQHPFVPTLSRAMAQTRSMEAFSADTKTTLLNSEDPEDRLYLSFIDAMEKVQKLRPAGS
jgi:hypothetical protein